MGTEEAKKIFREAAATAECNNAIARNQGLGQRPVRGYDKATTVLLWFALARHTMWGIELLGGWA